MIKHPMLVWSEYPFSRDGCHGHDQSRIWTTRFFPSLYSRCRCDSMRQHCWASRVPPSWMSGWPNPGICYSWSVSRSFRALHPDWREVPRYPVQAQQPAIMIWGHFYDPPCPGNKVRGHSILGEGIVNFVCLIESSECFSIFFSLERLTPSL